MSRTREKKVPDPLEDFLKKTTDLNVLSEYIQEQLDSGELKNVEKAVKRYSQLNDGYTPVRLTVALELAKDRPWFALSRTLQHFALKEPQKIENLEDEPSVTELLSKCEKNPHDAEDGLWAFGSFCAEFPQRYLFPGSETLIRLWGEEQSSHIFLLEAISSINVFEEGETERLFLKVLESSHDPYAGAAGVLLGIHRISMDDHQGATEVFQRTYRDHSKCLTLNLLLGDLLCRDENQKKQGLEHLRQWASLLQEDDDEATQIVQRYLNLRKNELFFEREDSNLQLERALAILKKERQLESALVAAQHLSRQGVWLGDFYCAQIYLTTEKLDEALGAFSRCIHLSWKRKMVSNQALSECIYQRASINAALGNRKRAFEHLKTVLRKEKGLVHRVRKDPNFSLFADDPEYAILVGSEETENGELEQGLAVGSRVSHTKFGGGTIEEISGSGEKAKVTISFDDAGQKKLLARFIKPA